MASHAQALSIEYGNILAVKYPNLLIEYDNMGTESKFVCNINTKKCQITKKENFGKIYPYKRKKSLQAELDDKKATHITFSPSKNLVAYYVRPSVNNGKRSFVIKNIKTSKDYILSSDVNYWDLVQDGIKIFEFSPDNKTLVYTDDVDGVMSLYKVNIASLSGETLTSTKLTTSIFSVVNFIYSDKNTLYYIGNNKDNPYLWSLYRLNLKTGKDSVVESNVSYLDSIRKIDSYFVFNHLEKSGYGPEVYNLNTKKIEHFKVPKIDNGENTAKQEVVKIENMSAVIMNPPKYDSSKTYSLVIWLHGGPLRQASYIYHPYQSYGTYDSILNLLQKDGVIVLKLDYRGSLGFGRAYSESIKDSVGTGDVTDVMNAVSYMKNKYNIGNVYLSGNSYGGYLSLRTIVEHPDSFTGAFSINGVTDWESLLTSIQTSIFNIHFNGLPSDTNKALYEQASIINRIGSLGNQKIQIVQGGEDMTIPSWQATLLYDKLKSQGKNATLTTYPDEDHVFKDKKNISDLCVQFFNFLEIPADLNCSN